MKPTTSGTGKTLTAECVAEHERRPLYAISCGDLGTDPERLEVKLKEVFNYAVAWKAILLLDEADIFLQERSIDDVNRNALVSIFLRELEYYDGILFVSQHLLLSISHYDILFFAAKHEGHGTLNITTRKTMEYMLVHYQPNSTDDQNR